MLKKILICASICISINAMEEKNLYGIIVPVLDGRGGESFVKNSIINVEHYSFYKTLEKQSLIDLGQDNCIGHFDEQFQQDPLRKELNDPDMIAYCVSQGTATFINWFAEQSPALQEKFKLLFFEAVLGSGNSAIFHTIDSFAKPLSYIPFARHILPWAAITQFPSYKPYGKSAFSSAEKIPANIPVIIMHNEYDGQLDVNDARKLYCQLAGRNKNVYYFESNDAARADFNILIHEKFSERMRKIAALQVIFKRHDLPYNKKINIENVNLSEFQPPVEEIQMRIENSTKEKNKIRNYIDFSAVASLGVAASAYLASQN